MKPLDFLIGPSSLPLAFQKKLYHLIWIWKNTPKINYVSFLKLGMNLAMKTNSIDKNICHWVDASYDGSILAKTTLPISSYKIFLNDSNEHGCYFLKCYYYNL